MKPGRIISRENDIRKILSESHTIAVLGLSPKPERDSFMVARYLKDHGYKIIPVRPAQKEILGERAYSSLDDIEEPIDIVDVFRRSDQIMPHVQEAIRPGAKVFWMQSGIENQEAAKLLTDAGIDVVTDKCIKVEHAKFIR